MAGSNHEEEAINCCLDKIFVDKIAATTATATALAAAGGVGPASSMLYQLHSLPCNNANAVAAAAAPDIAAAVSTPVYVFVAAAAVQLPCCYCCCCCAMPLLFWSHSQAYLLALSSLVCE